MCVIATEKSTLASSKAHMEAVCAVVCFTSVPLHTLLLLDEVTRVAACTVLVAYACLGKNDVTDRRRIHELHSAA